METIYLCLIIFLFILAVFDLSVGVSNDAVNFLNSAIGSKAASFKAILIIAAIGVFFGASMSNGMMDIARHGIFKPEHFYFGDLMYIFLAVIVADIILLDIFNTMGLPTSTTVSMVFELLGASFTIAVVKVLSGADALGVADYINTDKALSVIIAIFVSVAVAFFFGAVVQYISRLVFTFHFKRNLKWKIGIYGGIATTAIIYFMLIKGMKDLSFMTPEVMAVINEQTPIIVGVCFVVSTLLMQLFHAIGINVLKLTVMLGTFALAMAFAGNDLVNFIGVPLAGLASYEYYLEAGGGDVMSHLMGRMNEPARTPILYLVIAGAIMVFSLVTSKKAHNVVKTSVDLSRQDSGEEMFDSSRAARRIVRWANGVGNWFVENTPPKVRKWINSRFDTSESDIIDGAAFDLVRASVNLVLAGLLIALGTSLKLPLSTTYVTFMVAMGSSLADRAWSRESAVFRITGVISIIGGWLLTAGAAFLLCSVVVLAMWYGGIYVTVGVCILAIVQIIRSNLSFNKKLQKEDKSKNLFQQIVASKDKQKSWELLKQFISETQTDFLVYMAATYKSMTEGFVNEDLKTLRKSGISLPKEKNMLKSIRRKQTLGLRKVEPRLAIENNTWLHISYNSSQQMIYCLMRMYEPCLEHIDNNFAPLPDSLKTQFQPIRDRITEMLEKSHDIIEKGDYDSTVTVRNECDKVKAELSSMRKDLINHIHENMETYSVVYVYLNILQESQEMISSLRHMLRAIRKIQRER